MTLRPHQRRVAQRLLQRRGLIAIHSTGTGKTLAAVAAAKCLLASDIATRVVVLMKKTILDQFRAEILRFWPEAPLQRFWLTTPETFCRSGTKRDDFAKRRTFFVVDEAHQFANPRGAATRKLLAFAAGAARVLLLSATVFQTRRYDIAPLVAMVKGESAPMTLKAFLDMPDGALVRWVGPWVDVKILGTDNPRFAKVTVHRKAIHMCDDTWAVYKARARARPAKPFYMDTRLLSLGHTCCEKCEWLATHLRDWMDAGQGKVVVYTKFLDKGVQRIKSTLRSVGVRYGVIDGSTTAKERTRLAALFNVPVDPDAWNARNQNANTDFKFRRNARSSIRGDMRRLVSSRHLSGIDTDVCGVNRTAFTREKAKGGAFVYRAPDGTATTLTPEQEADVKALAIPPMWNPAAICTKGNQVVWGAVDKAGRWQRRYSLAWRQQQEFKKVMGLKHTTSSFWAKFDADVAALMASENKARRQLGAVVRLMQTTRIRPGWRRPALADPHYGALTLLRRHVTFDGANIHLDFIGKSGKRNTVTVVSSSFPALAAVLRSKARLPPDARLWPDVSVSALKDWLRRHDIKAKDFRTFFANATLLDALRRHDSPLLKGALPPDAKLFTRRRVLAAAMRVIAAGLNNTPRMARDSYVFSGFTAWYLADPVDFTSFVAAHASASGPDLLAAAIRYFETIDWRRLLAKLDGNGPSKSGLDVLLVTDAGAESLDLKGVRHVVFLDPAWTPSLEDQVVGRGVRAGAHAHLPPSQRTVDVWFLLLVPPKTASKHGVPVADTRVKHLADTKRVAMNDWYRLLERASV